MSAQFAGFDLNPHAPSPFAADAGGTADLPLIAPHPSALLRLVNETMRCDGSQVDPYALFLAALHGDADAAAEAHSLREHDLNATTLAQRESTGGSLLPHELAQALERSELSVVYQPRVDPHTGIVRGAEALLRWHSARFGCVSPDVFIPTAERTGLIIPFGNWVLREAGAELRRWIDAGLTGVCMSVNVSMHQLLHPQWEANVRAVINEYAIPPGALELELTESAVMHDKEESIEALHRIRRMGVRIAVDDFGTGYSCLAYLKRLPVDTLKIDKEFTTDIGISNCPNTLVAAMVAMAHSLGIRVVVEGVETRTQFDYLAQRECDEIQGFYCSPPLVAEECRRYVALHR